MAKSSMLEQYKARKTSTAITVDIEAEIEFLETKNGVEYIRFPLTDGRKVVIFESQTESMAEFEDAIEDDGVWPTNVKALKRMWKSGSGYQITDASSDGFDPFA